MPIMNGFELYENLKKINNEIKVIFMTASNINFEALSKLLQLDTFDTSNEKKEMTILQGDEERLIIITKPVEIMKQGIINYKQQYHSLLKRPKFGNNKQFWLEILTILILSIIGLTTFSQFNLIQVGAQQQENGNSNSYNISYKLSLSTVSTAVGTKAAATGAIVTVLGLIKTRKQSKCGSTYSLKIHHKYDEVMKTDLVNAKEYLDFLEGLDSDIISSLQRRQISENQYKMLEDRIIGYLNKINNSR